MTVTVVNELEISTFLSEGPLLDVTNSDKIFESTKNLGIPYELEIHSSINGMYRYGSITFFDDNGIRETLPLTGNEIITIMYKNAIRSSSNLQSSVVHFNIFDIEEYPYNENSNDSKRFTSKLIKFHLIECPFFLLYNHNLWQQAFGKDTGTNDPNDKVFINKIFEDHIVKDLKLVNPTSKSNLIELNLQKMSTKMHFIMPSWKSQQSFAYLLDFCRDEDGYGNVKFYNTTNNETGKIKINLRSLNNMFKSENKTYEFSMLDESGLSDFKKNIEQVNNKTINLIIKHKFLFYDISTITSGLAGAYLSNFDYENSQYYTLYDSYENSNNKKENPYFSNYALWNNSISNENSKQYSLGTFPRVEAKKYLNNKITKNKHQLRCEFTTYVDEQIYPGDKISAIFMSGLTELTRDRQTHLFDEHMSDEWVVEDIIDSYRNGKCVRKMIVVKDSFFNIYDKSTGSDNSKSPLPKINYVNKGSV